MPMIDRVLTEDIQPDATVVFTVPGLRPGDVVAGTASVSVDGVNQPDAELSVDFTLQTVEVTNKGTGPWMADDVISLSWEGELIEDRVVTLEANLGIIDGSEAVAGQVGEYLSESNTVGVAFSSDVPTEISRLTLSPGDWEVWGAVDFKPPSNVSPNMIAASISLYPDALPSEDDLIFGVGILNMFTTNSLTSGQRQVLMTGNCRSNSTTGLNLYLVAQISFSGGSTVTTKGYICARRVR